jgi:ABC-type transport system involved in multi-copper enzyme maturation permease subunit
MRRRHFRKALLVVCGILFVAFGVGAFFGLPGGHDASHHTIGHNMTHILAGLVVLAVAWAGSASVRRWFSFAFGAVYIAIGIFGFYSALDSLRILPGLIEFHLEDTWILIGTGMLFTFLGLLRSRGISTAYPRRAWAS